MNSSKEYTPINCNLYDCFEEAATLKKKCVFLIKEDSRTRIENGQIVDFYIKDKVEYLRLKKGKDLRLDTIQQFNDIDCTKGEPCKIS